MAIDLAAEFIAALRSQAGQAAIADAICPVITSVMREQLEQRDADRHMHATETGRYIGKPSTKAFQVWLSRSGGAEFAKLAIDIGGRRCWRKSDVDAWLQGRRAEQVAK